MSINTWSKHHSRPFLMTERCTRNGCGQFARYAARLCIPVKGLHRFEPFTVLVGIEVCAAHFVALLPRELLNKATEGIATEIMRKAGAAPDFAAAWLQPVHIMSKEYLTFKREQRGEGART